MIWSSTATDYVWYDGAVQASIAHDGDTGSASNPVYTTSFAYNGFGQLVAATIGDGKPRTVTFTNDELGQVIRRDETRPYDAPSGQAGSPHEIWYRFGGRQLGYTGNNGSDDLTTPGSITDRQVAPLADPGTYRNGRTYGGSYADFAQSYDPLNSYNQGSGTGTYSVRAGDTLQSIAASLWGDANLWYKLAEANGLTGQASLVEGQGLILPAGVVKSSHNASTFTPYDPADALGDLSPDTAPKPKKKSNKCGVFGQILVAAIAIGVTIATKGAGAKIAGALLGVGKTATGAVILGGALSAAAGSVASQAFGVASGIQSGFSWKGVGLAAIGGAVGGALGEGGLFKGDGLFGGLKSDVLAAGLRGGAASAISQGIGLTTGLQSKFDFAGVAAAGVGAGIGNFVGGKLDGRLKSNFAEDLLANTAGGIANAATRSAIKGNSFGDNLIAALPDVIGQALGSAAARGVGTLARAVGESAEASPTESRAETIGDAYADLVNFQSVQKAIGGEDVFTNLNVNLAASLVAKEIRLSDGRSLAQFAADTEAAEMAISANGIVIPANGAYGGESRFSTAVSFLDTARYFLPQGSEVIRGFAGSVVATAPSLQGLTVEQQMILGERYGAEIAVQGLGTNGRAADPYGLRIAQSFLTLAAEDSSGAAFWGAARDVVAQTMASLNAKAEAVVDVGVVGNFTKLGAELGVEPIGLALTAKDLVTGELSWEAATAGGILSAGVYVASRGRIKPIAAENAVPRVTTNRLAGHAFRDEIAAALRAEGRGVQTEVYKKTPFGARYMDIEVSDVPGGTVLGGIETKLGNSRYTPSQRAKDMFLKIWEKYPVNVIREPR